MSDLPIPAVPGIKATGWLVLEATRYAGGQAREMKLSRVTQRPPSLSGTDVCNQRES
jgi:hypothetical protein